MEKESLPTWAIVLIIVGSVLVVTAGVLVPVLIIRHKKKLKALEEEAIVKAGKKKIDTTDDKTIDVYADEEATEETATEAPAEVAEEPVVEEATVEEAVEEPVVETVEEAVEEAETPKTEQE